MSQNIKVCIVDYGGGNVNSVFNIFQSLVEDVVISNREEDLRDASHIVLPGVGAFGEVMRQLNETGVIPLLYEQVVVNKKPFLGICVGMQILGEKGLEHGEHDGLAWIPGIVERMDTRGLILPHMGWNDLIIKNNECELFSGMGEHIDFYFVHSYYFRVSDGEFVKASFDYGQQFTAVVQKDNICGVQFHPEKSQKAGKAILKNFLRMS